MFLVPDSEEQEISNAAAAFVGNEFPLERLHENPRDPNKLPAFSELGWLGLSAPEEAGGIGLSIVEEMLFFIQLGRVAGPVNVLSQILAVATARENPDICAPLIAGEQDVALLVATHANGEIRLIGDASASFALSVTPSASTLYRLDGSSCRAVPCLDSSVGMYLVDASAITPLVSRNSSDVWIQSQIDVSAMMVGLAERALDMIVGYAKERQTFGRPIGAYQAVRHPCSDMAVRIEAARCQLFYAATAIKEGHQDAAMHTDAARLLSDRAAKANTDTNIQLHGGIGVTDEHSAHLLMKRANLLGRLFGSGKQSMSSLLTLADNAEV